MEGVRVVLVKPGDVLVFGNVGDLSADSLANGAEFLKERLGLAAVVFFAADIDLAAVPAAALPATRES